MGRKLLSMFLVLSMLLTMVPGLVAAEGDPGYEGYNILVGGVKVTEENQDNVLGDGGTVTYNPNTKTLTLNNTTINGVYQGPTLDSETPAYYGIYADTDNLNIVLVGSNKVISQYGSNIFSAGIYTANALTISGSSNEDSLSVSSGTGAFSTGIYSLGDLTISNATITAASAEANTTSIAIASGGTITISESVVNATSPQKGIYGYLSVTSGTMTAQGGTMALDGSLTTPGYEGCTVTAGSNKNGDGAGEYETTSLSTYKYLKVEPTAGGTVTEQFTLTPGGTYYFDLSGEKGNIGTVNAALPDTTLHYAPFTYAGTVNAYSLTSAMATTEEYANTYKSDRSLFVGDYNVGTSISWNSLNTANLIFGKTFDTNYKLRSLSVGSSKTGSASDGSDNIGQPNTNEWDQILTKSGSTNNTTGWIKNWNSMLSWGQDTSVAGESYRAYRGGLVRQWNHSLSSSGYPNLGFRPALEVLNPDGLKAVTLNLNGGKLKNSTADINIICAGDDFTAPSGEGLAAPAGTTFEGWKDSSGATTYAAGATVPNTVTGLTAQWVAPATAYNLWVGGVQVTSANASDVLGDGRVSYTPAAGGSAQTLTLNGADIGAESQYRWDSTTVIGAKAHAAVYAKENLNVVLTGNNSLTGGSQDADKDESYGLYCGGALTITGDGALETSGATMNKPSCGSYGLFVKGTLSIGDGATVTARGGDLSGGNGVSFGVLGKDGDGLTVENATLTVAGGTGYNSFGIRIMQGDISITNSNVTVTSSNTPQYSRALETDNGDILISSGTVSASAEKGANEAYCIAISVPTGKNIAISSGAVVTARAGSAGYGGRAMSKAPNLDSFGSEYYITASRAYNGGSPETYNASDINNYRYLDIRQRTATPTTGTTSAGKSSASQNSVSFMLTNSSAYPSALTWNVYSGPTGEALANGVTATKSGDTLTLSHAVNIPAATYYVAVKESGKAESERLALIVGAFVPASLTGTATISNTAPRIGYVLTGSLSGGNNTGTLSYAWKVGGETAGTGDTYTVSPADLGKTITLTISSSIETGVVTGAATAAVLKKSAPTAPGAPTLASKNHNSVSLTANAAYEFSMDGSTWQASNVFSGLTPSTAYTFYQRAVETADTESSTASTKLNVTTDTAPVNALTGTATISNTAPRIGDVLNGSLSGGNNTGTLSYAWKVSDEFGDELAGTDANTYTVKPADLGKTITLTISSSVETGVVTGAATAAVLKKSAPTAPGAPTLASKNHNSVSLTANAAYEFSMDGSTWQTSNVFGGLTASTAYTFYQRLAETADTENSAASTQLAVTTQADNSSGTGGSSSGGSGSGDTDGTTATPAEATTTVKGSVVEKSTGKTVGGIDATVTTASNNTLTLTTNTEQVIQVKRPGGDGKSLADLSRIGLRATENGTGPYSANITLAPNGTIEISNLKMGEVAEFAVTYDLGDGQKIAVGRIRVEISSAGVIGFTSTLIDPFGVITDAHTGEQIPGAKVTLYYADSQRNKAAGKTPGSIVSLPTLPEFDPNQNHNPQTSDKDGAYGFMVYPETDYHLVVQKGGYVLYQSPIITVEEDIVRWDIKLQDEARQTTGVQRIAGLDRVETALAIAKRNYPNGIKNVILARADSYPDALAGSPLGYKYNAPILLVGQSDSAQAKVLTYLDNQMDAAGTVYILGGSAAVSTKMQEKIAASGFKHITRLDGSDRFETAAKIAGQLDVLPGTPVFLVGGDSYPDALSAGPLAAMMQSPVFLVGRHISTAVEEQLREIKPVRVYIIGGEGTLSKDIEKEVIRITGQREDRVIRIGGAIRYETSLNIAKFFDLQGPEAILATGWDFPDALAGSVYAANLNAPIILVDGEFDENLNTWLKNSNLTGALILGGEKVIGTELEQALTKIIKK